MMGLQKLPEPDDETKEILEEDVNQVHEDSSDDELLTDDAFRNASKELTHDLINSLHDDHIEAIQESIRQYKYGELRKRGELTDDTLRQLGFKKADDKAVLPVIGHKTVNSAGFQVIT